MEMGAVSASRENLSTDQAFQAVRPP